jgi:hypothetical protein
VLDEFGRGSSGDHGKDEVPVVTALSRGGGIQAIDTTGRAGGEPRKCRRGKGFLYPVIAAGQDGQTTTRNL